MNEQLQIRMKGELGDRLSAFREEVGLARRGRLSDEWDEEFGRRELRSKEEGRVRLTLWRYADDDWTVSLTYERDPLPDAEVAELRRSILDAAARAGMTISAQSPS
ncbi:hypothetical protein [Streptomyces sp. NPDC047981]|uniref:hypothetical protein n=1 Tax=Streptomyces sp. NPDC047981 TaxID=3154610 RepID=UPI003430DD42